MNLLLPYGVKLLTSAGMIEYRDLDLTLLPYLDVIFGGKLLIEPALDDRPTGLNSVKLGR